MRYLLVGVLVLCVSAITLKLGHIPSNYVTYPEASEAHVSFVNDEGHGTDIVGSDVVFGLYTNIGACDTIGLMHIKTDGTINICTEGGWVIK